MHSFSWLLVTVVSTVVSLVPPSHAFDQLPIREGTYMRSADHCEKFKSGELDMIDFQIETEGREFGYPEVGCYVATVQQLRPNRYVVEADCLEFGNPPSQRTIVLDLIGARTIRVDGREFVQCDLHAKEMDPENVVMLPPLPEKKGAVPKLTRLISSEELIEEWDIADEDCRGGSGDDPATQEACELRTALSERLEKAGWCFGKKNQAHSAYRWHKCGKGSIHFSR